MSDDLALADGLPEYGLTGLGALGLMWVLGPTVRAFGKNLGRWTDYHTSNLLHLSEKVKAKLGDEPDDGIRRTPAHSHPVRRGSPRWEQWESSSVRYAPPQQRTPTR